MGFKRKTGWIAENSSGFGPPKMHPSTSMTRSSIISLGNSWLHTVHAGHVSCSLANAKRFREELF